jgi:pimeloyl-ACP methyl ester carboxylesterase
LTQQTKYFDTRDGCHIAYEITGEGQPLVLIHGWTFNRTIWAPQVSEFSQHYKTITYDRRGYGESDGNIDLRKELDDLNDLLDHLEIKVANIIGMSQGGRIALRYTLTRQENVKTLVLQCAPLDGYVVQKANEGEQIPLEQYISFAEKGDIKSVRDGWMNHQLMDVPSSKSSVKKRLREIVDSYSGEDLGNIMEQMVFPINVAENLQQIEVPTLIIQGNKETSLAMDIANTIFERINGSKKIVIPGNGHLINLLEPKKYNKAVLDFLDKYN